MIQIIRENSNKSRRYIHGYGIRKSSRKYIYGYGLFTDMSNFAHNFSDMRDVGQAAIDVYKIGKNTRDIVKKLREKPIEDELIEKLKIGAGIEIV